MYLRIDDLDPQRSREEYVQAAREDLRWLGIAWEAEVRESQRLARYRDAMLRLLHTGHVYPCICSRKDLQQAVQAPHDETDDEPVYNGRCRPVHNALRENSTAEVLLWDTNYRFRVPDGEPVPFLDGNCGPQSFLAGADFGDFLVWRKDGLPSYQLATVVDEADLGITEVVRGRDLLKSTARQLLLHRALDLPAPRFFHTALLRDEQGVRLAKRNDALSLRSLRAAGASPAEIRARVEALLHQTQ